MQIQNTLLTTVRHSNTYVAVSNHSVANGHQTKLILAESNVIVIFKLGLGNRVLNYLLDQYLGLDKAQIKRLKSNKGRAVCVVKSYPMLVVHNSGAYVLNREEDYYDLFFYYL